MPACPACPVAPGDGTGVGPVDRTGVVIFSHALILNKNPHLWMDTNYNVSKILQLTENKGLSLGLTHIFRPVASMRLFMKP